MSQIKDLFENLIVQYFPVLRIALGQDVHHAVSIDTRRAELFFNVSFNDSIYCSGQKRAHYCNFWHQKNADILIHFLGPFPFIAKNSAKRLSDFPLDVNLFAFIFTFCKISSFYSYHIKSFLPFTTNFSCTQFSRTGLEEVFNTVLLQNTEFSFTFISL